MKIGLYYFSGTGNTRLIAGEFKAAFVAQGADCELIPVEKITLKTREVNFEDCDLWGLGFPVHAFDAPRIVYDFVNLLPRKRARYFLFKTAGSAFLQGGSTHRLRRALAGRGWLLAHESFYEMPPNIFSVPEQEKVDAIVTQARAKVPEAVAEILAGQRRMLKDGTLRRALSLINRLETAGCYFDSPYWFANGNCTRCGKCARNCPTRNITVTADRPVFKYSCIFCLRCWWNCPARAISHRRYGKWLPKNPYKLNS